MIGKKTNFLKKESFSQSFTLIVFNSWKIEAKFYL